MRSGTKRPAVMRRATSRISPCAATGAAAGRRRAVHASVPTRTLSAPRQLVMETPSAFEPGRFRLTSDDIRTLCAAAKPLGGDRSTRVSEGDARGGEANAATDGHDAIHDDLATGPEPLGEGRRV